MKQVSLTWIVASMVVFAGCGGSDRPVAATDASTDSMIVDDAMIDGGNIDGATDGDVDAGTDASDDASLSDAATDSSTIPPTCTDTIRNGMESDVDCGGNCPNRCADRARCNGSPDCSSSVCIGNVCIAATCTDGIRNGMETGRDCGGTCGGCGLGEGCVNPPDCAMGSCVDHFCVASHCSDGMMNSGETDLDCGGADCGPCMAGQNCLLMRDCYMSQCGEGHCLTPACSNNTLDTGEFAIDCGGECPGCPDGTACAVGPDCASDRCETDVCTSCADGVRNGSETGIDCGGPCRGCSAGDACMGPMDCASRECTGNVCQGASTFYFEDFNAGNGGWTVGGAPTDLWEYGTPAKTFINRAYSGTSVWTTKLGGTYPASADGWVTSPPFSLAGATQDPILVLRTTYRSEENYDVARVEISTNGTAWTVLGGRTSGRNWYNSTSVSRGVGWASGSGTAWQQSEHILVGMAGQASVQIRIRFGSDTSGQYDGFAFDDVEVRDDICNNDVRDPAETDVDCGGDFCAPCADRSMCVRPTDCESGACAMNVCVSCADGVRNGNESDVDCGGDVCAPCMDGRVCGTHDDCLSDRCDNLVCTSCFDGAQNGGESYIDCGGGGCLLCGAGAPCSAPEQCASASCDAGSCTAPLITGYSFDFEADNGGFVAEGTASSWAWGVPAHADIPTAGQGTRSWVTNLTGTYNSSESSFLTSPALDFSGFTMDPVISFLHRYRTEVCCDEGWLERSIDGGATWTKVLGGPDSNNWYNSTTANVWNGTSGSTWRVASSVLAGTAGQRDVRFRFAMHSDSSVNYGGFGVDDIRIAAPAPDLAVSLTPSPMLCDGVVAEVRNVGSRSISFFDLSTNIDGVLTTTRVSMNLAVGATHRVDLRAMRTVEVAVSSINDLNPDNDRASRMVAGLTLGTRYVETFEGSPGGWTANGTASSWAHGTPAGFFITNADSGSNAWVTNLTSNYNVNEMSYLLSPCFDFSTLGRDPTLSFSYIHDIEPTNDFAYVEITADGGMTWTRLGAFGTGTNWYNDLAGNFWDGRSAASGVWLRGTHALSGTAGSNRVRMRIAFVSNATTVREGFGLDDVIVTP